MASQPDPLEFETLRRMDRNEFERLIALDLFDEDERVELLEGLLYTVSPPGPEHMFAVRRIVRALVLALGEGADVSCQDPVGAGRDSMPQPDIAVLLPGLEAWQRPNGASLVVEVALTSLRRDRGIKARVYAKAGVPEYWIVNLRDRVVEVYTAPVGDAYTEAKVLTVDEKLVPTAFPGVAIPIRDILPRS